MKKLFVFNIYVLLIVNHVFCQNLDSYDEQAILTIDRSIYITGEQIKFSIVFLSNAELLSKIAYVELITPSGEQVAGTKNKIEDSKSYGELIIPKSISTGNYYIRAYTKYMRNFGPSGYDYNFVKIINPYKNDILNSFPSDSNINLVNEWDNDFNIHIKLSEKVFKTNEEVKVEIGNDFSDSIKTIFVSVIPKFTDNYKKVKFNIKEQKTNTFIPETRGITLTGVLKNELNDKPLRYKKISLSILENKQNSFYSVISNEYGRFYFSLPDLIGNRDIFISSERLSHDLNKLYIDNDFCTKSIHLPNPKFSLSKGEQEIAYKLAVNLKIREYFSSDSVINQANHKFDYFDTLPFYGTPDQVLLLDEYISLPTLEDYITEIPFRVKIKRTKEFTKFKIVGDHPELFIYDPLVMVDLVPINNVDDILSISPTKISRIDLINSPYVRGSIIYGGVLNFISKNNDFAGIDLPRSGIFINYSFLNKPVDNLQDASQNKRNIPDSRNTLYWNSVLTLNHNRTITFNFKTSHVSGDYIIYIRGITVDGKTKISRTNFKIE